MLRNKIIPASLDVFLQRNLQRLKMASKYCFKLAAVFVQVGNRCDLDLVAGVIRGNARYVPRHSSKPWFCKAFEKLRGLRLKVFHSIEFSKTVEPESKARISADSRGRWS